MKKLILLTTISILILFFLNMPVFAQTNNLLLAVTPYKTREDLDFLFSQSTQVLEYLEGEDVESPIFLSVINEPQKVMYINKGFIPRIIDNNTDIPRYVLLYHPRENQSQKLLELGEVFPISKHYTLLKTLPNKPFTHEDAGLEFFDVPFSKIIVPPPLRTKTALSPTPALTSALNISPTPSPALSDNKNKLFTFIGVSFTALLVIILLFIYRFYRRKNIPYYKES